MKRTEFTQGWLDALRSGEYKQGQDKLHYKGKYCCLGVAASLCGVDVDDDSSENYVLLDSKLALSERERFELTYANDFLKKDFTAIADMIEGMIEPE